ncbi:hypothetical protein HanPSC8_Chr11g0463811 [Helianthus annuus]|nr:hypothetical protein HanPSC8_Chr11g0463811 [Helianthus annuus]
MEPQGTGEDGEHDGGMAVVGGFDEAVFFIGNKYSERGVEDEDNYAGVFESSSKDIVACDAIVARKSELGPDALLEPTTKRTHACRSCTRVW